MPARAAIYLDANAGASLSESARAELLSLLCDTRAEALGPESSDSNGPGASARARILLPNPSSSHAEGRRAKALLRTAKARIAASLGPAVRPEELTLVSSGTEAAQLAIHSVFESRLLKGEKPHWIFTAGDHDAHLQLRPWLEDRGVAVTRIGLRPDGAPDLDELESALRPDTALVSAIWANNETGVLTDVARLSRICAARGVPLHLDAAQAWGKLELALGPELAQFASFSGPKIGALSGTGVLWQSPRLSQPAAPRVLGKQEGGRRGGTENLLGAVSLGAAAARLDPASWQSRVAPLRDRLEREVLARIPGARVHGAGAPRVANTSSFGFEGVEKEGLVAALDLAGYCVSSGSACSSGITESSQVLMAMGFTPAQARAAVRVSLPDGMAWDALESFVEALATAVDKARRLAVPTAQEARAR